MYSWRCTGGGGYIIWDRLGQENTWWISMYRWRCTGGGGYIILEKVGSIAYSSLCDPYALTQKNIHIYSVF